MKSDNSGAQEIECAPRRQWRRISAPKCFKTEAVKNKRLFSLKLLCIMAQDFNSVDTAYFCLIDFKIIKKQTLEHF